MRMRTNGLVRSRNGSVCVGRAFADPRELRKECIFVNRKYLFRRLFINSRVLISGFFLCLVFSVCSAVRSFGQGTQAAAFLQQRIATGTAEEKRDALFQIRNFKTEQASRIAVPALNDREEIVRATAASSVIFLPGHEAAQILLPLLNDKAEFVRREAAYALGEVGHSSAAGPLIKTLQNDKADEVRTAAAAALGKLGDASAVEDLLSILKNKPKEDEEFLRRASARSIGQIAQVIKTGKHRVVSPQNFLSEKYKETNEPFEDLTKQFPIFERAVVVLSQVLQNQREANDTLREAAFSLGAIGSTAAINVLQAHLNSPDPYLAEIAKEALLKIENQSKSLSSTKPKP